MNDVSRFLELVQRELEADDTRLEFGGKSPTAPAIWCELESGFRVVALFDSTPKADSRAEKQALLESLVVTFAQTLEEVSAPSFRAEPDRRVGLDAALDVLATQTHAIAAWVIDEHSPEVWGSSFEPRGSETVEDALSLVELRASLASSLGAEELSDAQLGPRLAGQEMSDVEAVSAGLRQRIEHFAGCAPGRTAADWRKRILTFDAVADLRESLSGAHGRTRHARHEATGPYLARTFGGVYRLLLVFASADFSELHAEAAMIHALPWIEKLTTALPPIDPDGGGRVVRMRRLRPV